MTTPKAETPRDVRIDVHHIQGYGGPDAWTVSAIDWHSNRLLEAVTTGSSREAGRCEARMEARWKADYTPQEWDALVALARVASPWCSRCGGHTLDGQTGIGDKVFCRTCVAAGSVEEERRRLVGMAEDAERRAQERAADSTRAYESAAIEAQAGFHWRDGWFAKRLSDGAVRICKVAPAPSHLGALSVEPTGTAHNRVAADVADDCIREIVQLRGPRAAPSVEARDVTLLSYPLRVDASIPADEIRFVQNGQIVGVIRLAPASLLPPEKT